MRKGIWPAAAVAGLLSAAAVFVIGPGVRAADTKVTMQDQLVFEPADVTVAVGGSVVWHNDGGIQHDAKAEDGSFSIPLVDPGKDSQPVSFKVPGDFRYYCTVPGHKSAGMVGTVHVGAASTPTSAASTTTTQPASGVTATTAPGQTTTTTRAGASGSGQSTTTTTAPVPGGATSTTLAPGTTPTSAPESAGGSAEANAAGAGTEGDADHSSEGAQDEKREKNSPIGIAFASVSTLLLVAIAGKLLASKP